MTVVDLDVQSNRRSRKYGTSELARRVLWAIVRPAFHYSPRPLFGWRRFLLRLFGATIGRDVHIYPSVVITMPWNVSIGDWSAVGDGVHLYALGSIVIGKAVTISQRAHLCAGTHDHTRRDMPLVRSQIAVGDNAWICAEAFVGPSVMIGDGSIAGARAVVVHDVGAWEIVAGNPARFIKRRDLRDT